MDPIELDPSVYDYTDNGKEFEEELMRAMLEPIPDGPCVCGKDKCAIIHCFWGVKFS